MAANENSAWLKCTIPWNLFNHESVKEPPMILIDWWDTDNEYQLEDMGIEVYIRKNNVIMLQCSTFYVKIAYRSRRLFNIYQGHIEKIINLDHETQESNSEQ